MDNEARAALAARCEGIAPNWGGPAGNEHMPFAGHRTVGELWADELRARMARGSGRG